MYSANTLIVSPNISYIGANTVCASPSTSVYDAPFTKGTSKSSPLKCV
jgi:hypothetical protein